MLSKPIASKSRRSRYFSLSRMRERVGVRAGSACLSEVLTPSQHPHPCPLRRAGKGEKSAARLAMWP